MQARRKMTSLQSFVLTSSCHFSSPWKYWSKVIPLYFLFVLKHFQIMRVINAYTRSHYFEERFGHCKLCVAKYRKKFFLQNWQTNDKGRLQYRSSVVIESSSKVTKLSCFRGTWKRRKPQTWNCGQRTFNGLNALNVPLVDLGKVTIFAEDKQKTSPALRKKYLDCHAVVPEHHALLAQPLPDAIGQHGDHVDQGGHEVLPHHVLDVHQPASEPVVVRDVDAVAHKLVCLHLIRTSSTT